MIKDTTQLHGFNHIKLPKIKGTVEIKLHNPTTGKTELYKGENMVTNAIADIFASNYCGALDYRALLPLWSKMYGGILCFRDQLNTTDTQEMLAANDYFIPDNDTTNGNPVTAHAGQTTFTSQDDDLTRGNPSNANMSIEDGRATLAWEWGLSAGNGNISALALTHTDVGDAGTGSTSTAFSTMRPVINATLELKTTYSESSPNTNLISFVGVDGYGYTFTASGSTVTLVKTPLAYNKAGLVTDSQILETAYTERINVSMPSGVSFSYNPDFCYVKSTNSLWLFYNETKSTSLTCVSINLATKTATKHNLSPAVAVGSLYSSRSPMQLPFDGESVYLRIYNNNNHQSGGLLRINLSRFVDQTNLTGNTGYEGGFFIPNAPHKILAGRYCVINNGVIYPTVQPNHGGNVIDSLYDTFNYVTANPYTDPNPGSLANLCVHTERNAIEYFGSVSKFYLGTKYNLPSTVIKSPSQSMIVTYTLEEVEPNENDQEQEEE